MAHCILYASVILFVFSLFVLHTHATGSVAEQHSLQPPLDKSQVYWSYGGHTVLSKDSIRLTSRGQDRRGWLWNEYPIEAKNFEIETTFDISSRPHLGGDGMALWIIKPPADVVAFSQNFEVLNGPVFGMRNDFNGFGVCIDVYDNDGRRNNPTIMVLKNDGRVTNFNHENDFENDMVSDNSVMTLEDGPHYRCVANVRNTGKHPKLLVRLLNEVLHVYVDKSDGKGYSFCLAVRMPGDFSNYHIAYSAATGQVADMMQLFHVSTKYLDDGDALFDDRSIPQMHDEMAISYSTYYWSFINLTGLLLIGIVGYQLHSLRTLASQRIDVIYIAQKLNPLQLPHFVLQASVTILLLFRSNWFGFVLNAPFVAWHGYLISKGNMMITPPQLVMGKGRTTSPLHTLSRLSVTLVSYVFLQLYYFYKCIW